MLIRWATMDDLTGWLLLADDVAQIFGAPDMARDPKFHEYVHNKIIKHEALIAVERRTNKCLGVIGFSRTHNRITWFGVIEQQRSKGIGYKLLRCALNQLDWTKEITVETFQDGFEPGFPARELYKKFGFVDIDNSLVDELGNARSKMAIAPTGEKKGASFHYDYARYTEWANIEKCPVCQKLEADVPPVLIKELEYSWVECCKEAQGRLFGKCHILSKKHSEHFFELSKEDMANFMSDVQKAAKAMQRVTGAIKINYEIHGNSLPHLHVHLFPRYMDDDFPSGPIDYRITEPNPYESDGEFCWFVEKMKGLLEE